MLTAPRISPRLRSELERLAGESLRAAEICRRLGDVADELGLPRPSYQRVRVLVNEVRGRPWRATTAQVAADVLFRVRPPQAIVDHISGAGVPKR